MTTRTMHVGSSPPTARTRGNTMRRSLAQVQISDEILSSYPIDVVHALVQNACKSTTRRARATCPRSRRRMAVFSGEIQRSRDARPQQTHAYHVLQNRAVGPGPLHVMCTLPDFKPIPAPPICLAPAIRVRPFVNVITLPILIAWFYRVSRAD
jgi:hypothetical protein